MEIEDVKMDVVKENTKIVVWMVVKENTKIVVWMVLIDYLYIYWVYVKFHINIKYFRG